MYMPLILRCDIRFPRRLIGTHVAHLVREPWREVFGGGDSERWLCSLWVRTASAPWCTGHRVLLKMLCFEWVTKTMLLTFCHHCRSQTFFLLSLPNLPSGKPAERISLSISISCYTFYPSCHQQHHTVPFHWVSATLLCNIPQISLGLMQWLVHEGLIMQSCWVRAPVLTYCYVWYPTRFQDWSCTGISKMSFMSSLPHKTRLLDIV